VVKGNHDNYIVQVLRELKVKLHDPSLYLGDYYLMHGNSDLEQDFQEAKYVFMGHEHPAVTIRDDIGVKHRFKAFLSGKIGNRIVTVLPSISPLSYGNPMNEMHRSQFMSPLLRKYGVDEFVPYLIEIGKSVKRFPEMKHIMLRYAYVESTDRED
jgi:hypothetical protein